MDLGDQHVVSASVVLEQSICYRLQGDQVVLEWVAFSTTKRGLKLSVDHLEQFEHEVSRPLLSVSVHTSWSRDRVD